MKEIIKELIPNNLGVFLIRLIRRTKKIINRQPRIYSEYPYIEFKCKGKHTFFGYYDIIPFGTDNRIIYQEVKRNGLPADIIINTLDNSQKKYVAKTNAWNWQQGSRLRWYNDNSIIFNDFVQGAYVSRIINVVDMKESVLPFPLYDLSSKSGMGLSLDFTRLGYKRPGYGYTNLPFDENDKELLNKGIDLYDLKDKHLIKTVSYAEIAEKMELPLTDVNNWYLNHLSFSPSGDKFLFFFIQDIQESFMASLLVYEIASGELKILDKLNKVSHYDWIDDDTIICTAYPPKSRCQYNIYQVSTSCISFFAYDVLSNDGHPTSIDRDTIITDTYPDSQGYQTIMKVTKECNKKDIARIYDVRSYRIEQRTDLHPRLTKNYIAVDNNSRGKRSMIVFKID